MHCEHTHKHMRARASLFIATNNNSKLVDRSLLAYIIILIEILLITTFAARQRENEWKLACANSKWMNRNYLLAANNLQPRGDLTRLLSQFPFVYLFFFFMFFFYSFQLYLVANCLYGERDVRYIQCHMHFVYGHVTWNVAYGFCSNIWFLYITRSF